MGFTSEAACAVVPVAAIVPVLVAGAYLHYGGNTTAAVDFVERSRRGAGGERRD